MSRPERVAEQIKKIVSGILTKDLDDPGLGFVTVTKVAVSPDLENATVYVSVLGEEEKKKTSMEALDRATGYVKGILGDKLALRMVPKLRFAYDESLEKASRLWNLMSKKNGKNSPSDK
ncbi:MAG: 30S ribosome-binding factor RbfA [Candidatus Margulisiibacteriota bacterium]